MRMKERADAEAVLAEVNGPKASLAAAGPVVVVDLLEQTLAAGRQGAMEARREGSLHARGSQGLNSPLAPAQLQVRVQYARQVRANVRGTGAAGTTCQSVPRLTRGMHPAPGRRGARTRIFLREIPQGLGLKPWKEAAFPLCVSSH